MNFCLFCLSAFRDLHLLPPMETGKTYEESRVDGNGVNELLVDVAGTFLATTSTNGREAFQETFVIL